MKTILCILFLFQVLQAGATHWLTYYVYYETEYTQGPWSGSALLYRSDYRYLAPREYTDLFGTEPTDLVEKMLQRLGEIHPEAYTWSYELELHGDTVVFNTLRLPSAWERVRNEVTATLTLNGFKAVAFQLTDTTMTATLADLTLPYFDLVEPQRITSVTRKDALAPEAPAQGTSPADELQVKEGDGSHGPMPAWLVLSLLLNLILGVALFLTKRK